MSFGVGVGDFPANHWVECDEAWVCACTVAFDNDDQSARVFGEEDVGNAVGGSRRGACLAERDGTKRVEGAKAFGRVGRAGHAGEDAAVTYTCQAERFRNPDSDRKVAIGVGR